MRFFVALEIPTESKEQLEIVQQRLNKLIPQIRLTDNDKLHLTIAFVGDQPDDLKNLLVEAMKKAAEGIKAFTVTPGYIDGFPHLHDARVLWVGMKGDVDKLFILRERIKDGLINLGLDVDDRRYIPHIAIAKVNDFNLKNYQEDAFENVMEENHFNPIPIHTIKLFESIPNEGFHQHNTLAEIFLDS